MRRLSIAVCVGTLAAFAYVASGAQAEKPAEGRRSYKKPADDQSFMKEAAAAGAAEIEAARLALEKATRPDVKSFAQMVMDDHKKANEELKSLAASKSVALPSEPTAAQKATRDRLSKLSGEAFDNAYIDATVTDHQKAVALFSKESKGGSDPETKAFASRTLPTLEEHRTKAKALAGSAQPGAAATNP